jgi:beta-galactosidase
VNLKTIQFTLKFAFKLALCVAVILPWTLTAADLSWNHGWKFHLGDADLNADDGGWEAVSLPHTPRVESPNGVDHHFKGLCWYHKHFEAEPDWRGKKIQLRFDGAMQVAEVWLNGKMLTVHQGGYLPFTIDLTPGMNWYADNVVAVRLDNRDQPTIPPGKPLANLDFTYQGGLYRNVTLLVTDPLHISDVFEANRVAGGGIFVRTESADATNATIRVQADVQNDATNSADTGIQFTALDPRGRPVATIKLGPYHLVAGTNFEFTANLTVARPSLWHPDHPFLYNLETELRHDDQTIQTARTHFGIRTLAYDDKLGFVLNGEPLTLRGANRHQDFPWLGNAVPDNAQYRDLKRLKAAGFNFLRLAHYPQSSAVMDACDELGLMVSVCTPGWQWWDNDPRFRELARQDVREMVRWHRNHPSAIMWEVSLNETYGHEQFYAECAQLARQEYPGGQLFVSGDSYASRDVGCYDVPYAGWADPYSRPAAPGFEDRKRSFAREYGDYEFGGEHSTTRIAIGDGENAQLLQAWNFLWSHNQNAGWNWLIGDCIWVGVDHARGCSEENPISRCGVLDYFRRPKFSYYLYQSQRSSKAPMVFIANYWTPRSSPAKVVVFANCDEVELQLNGKTIARQKPDSGPDSAYGVWHPEADPLYMTKGKNVHDDEKASVLSAQNSGDQKLLSMFDGGNCRNVEHPPFTFAPVPFAAGELKAIGYIKGRRVCKFVRHTPGAPVALRLAVETLGRQLSADGTDAVFVRAEVIDRRGEVVPTADLPVGFAVTGPGKMISPAETKAEAGVATMLLQAADTSGQISVVATTPGLTAAKMGFHSQSAPDSTILE